MKRIFTLLAIAVVAVTTASALEVTLSAAGTLKEYITPEQQETVTELKVTGDINGDDLRIIRHMIGARLSSDNGVYAEVDSGACRVLDLSEANIIGEGFYTFKYVPKPAEGPAYYLSGMAVEANTITYAMFCGSKVETLILPNSVTYIGSTHRGTTIDDHCIDGSRLRSVTLPANLEHMAVYGTGLALRHREEGPDYYEEVPQSNLLASPNLAEVKIADSNTHFKLIDGVLYSGDLTELMLCPPKREGALEIPAATARIGYRACAATHITGDLTITAPDIAAEAFTTATIDGNVTLGPSPISISKAAFAKVTVAGNLTASGIAVIPEGCFYQAMIGGDLTPAGKIDKEAFYNASVKGKLNLNNVTDSIKASAFYGLKGNDFEITIPESVRYIGESAFCRASTTGTLIVPASLDSLCVYAFAFNGFNNIQINATTKYGCISFCKPFHDDSMGVKHDFLHCDAWDPFSHNYGITEIIIPTDMRTIPESFFSYCYNLSSIIIPDNGQLETIDPLAFFNCSAIEELKLPATIKLVEEGSFFRGDYDRCHRRVFIPKNTDNHLQIPQSMFSPNDTVFLWLDSDKIADQLNLDVEWYTNVPQNYRHLFYDPWRNYGYTCSCSCVSKWEDETYIIGPSVEEMPGTGVLFVPNGCKDLLVSYLNSHICTIGCTPTCFESTVYNIITPTFLYFKEIREFTDLGYPNYSLENSSVEGISADNTVTISERHHYDIYGRQLNGPAKGFNIIVYSDGSVEKVFVE